MLPQFFKGKLRLFVLVLELVFRSKTCTKCVFLRGICMANSGNTWAGFLSLWKKQKKRISDQSITCCCARYKVILPTNLVLCEHIISPIPAERPSMLYGCKWGCFSFCPAVSPMWLELMSLCQLCIYLNYSVFILFSFLGKISLQCR